jgi:hypothetical protein
MSNNIVESIQRNLGYPGLRKVNPNSQEVKDIADCDTSAKMAQSAITGVLAGLGHFTSSDYGANYILTNDSQDWLHVIFRGNESEAINKVARYSGAPVEEAREHMQKILREAVKLIRESAGDKKSPEKIKTYMKSQRHQILLYLPAAMQMGELLKDDSLDDRTNKMEGPVSNMMHNIENRLSGGGS